ncbi:Hpt domain-containing protein [Paraburkholderia sp. BCC1876]|uniref:Hpt domain-containing protein n=1 Tax=Paraburkholderia sp. BCC1876 TaxID=2676303 RepID=UPI0015902D2E|nr:Hpt domain-containing protein [Paraburkholderia sp. BCC1876]
MMTCAIAFDDAHALAVRTLELTGGDHFSARRLLALIVETNRVAVIQLRDGFAAQSWDRVGSAAHRVAGSACLLECTELIAFLTELQVAAREREIATVSALMQRAIDALERLDMSITVALDSALLR